MEWQDVVVASVGVLATIATCASLGSSLAGSFIYKICIWCQGFIHLFLSADKKFNVSHEPDAGSLLHNKESRSKTIIFIRHGESQWNEVFNKGFGPSFPIRLIKNVFAEILMFLTRDSVFVDSNLSQEGVDQAEELATFLRKEQVFNNDAKLIMDHKGDSVIVSSNLRRAMSTCAIALRKRLTSSGERVLMMSNLQEVTFNVDGLALAGPHNTPVLSTLDALKSSEPENLFDSTFNFGNKPLRERGINRMRRFCEWALNRPESTIIVGGGHSLYFRFFFQAFLPQVSQHIAKKKKMVNCGVVKFTLVDGVAEGKTIYHIEPNSINIVYGGFGGK